MGLGGLALFMAGMWAMILAVAAFLVAFVVPIDVIMFDGQASRLTVSGVQAAIAIIVVIALVFGLSRMKRVYMRKKIKQ
jgi:Na+/melibiose symporter-like transporter